MGNALEIVRPLKQGYILRQIILVDTPKGPEKVTIPRQSRGLSFMSRSKRLFGVATAAPSWEPPKGGVSVTETDLAVENVISGHCFTQPVFR